MFPLSAWLPDSYPTAPAPVTAVFAGLLTKVGVYAIIRTQTLLFPDSPLSDLLMWAALATMIIGILGAIAQSEIKRMLSFTLVSHIGYMIFGVALASEAGFAGAIFYTAHHITIQTTLFLVTGLIERRGGSTSLNDLGGLAALSPVLGVLFFVPAMNLAGIPPFSGFVGKIGLLEAGVAERRRARVRAGRRWRDHQPAHPVRHGQGVEPRLLAGRARASTPAGNPLVVRRRSVVLPRGMVVTTGFLVLVGVGITFVAGPLYGYARPGGDRHAQRAAVRAGRAAGRSAMTGDEREERAAAVIGDHAARAAHVDPPPPAAADVDRHRGDLGAAVGRSVAGQPGVRLRARPADHLGLPAAADRVPRSVPALAAHQADRDPAVRPGPVQLRGRGAGLPLRPHHAQRRGPGRSATRSDLYLTLTSELVSLVPGSLVMEARRQESVVYVHVMDVRSEADIESARREVLRGRGAGGALLRFGRRGRRTEGSPAGCREGESMSVADVIIVIGVIFLAGAMVMTLIRMSRGPSTLDRVVAADVVVAVVIAALAMEAAMNHHTTTLPIMLVLSLLGLRRLAEHGPLRGRPGQGQEVGRAVLVADQVRAQQGAAREPRAGHHRRPVPAAGRHALLRRLGRAGALPRRAHPDARRDQAADPRPAVRGRRGRLLAAEPRRRWASCCWWRCCSC